MEVEPKNPPSSSQTIESPLDLIRLSIDENIIVKCRNNRSLVGKLHAYDTHLNLVLGDVVESTSSIEKDEETDEESIKINKRNIDLLFVRGDGIILVSPIKVA